MLRFRSWIIAGLMVFAGAAVFLVVGDEGAQSKPSVLPEATRLIDRRGRIVSYQLDVLHEPTATAFDRTAFVSIDDNAAYILLENEKLQELEDITRRGEKVVRVWGTLSAYRGKNYLLLTRFRVPMTREREEEW